MAYHFVSRLEECMGKEQIFLNPKLTLSELALKVGTNRTYLSNYINQELNSTFFDYVNSRRLVFATELLLTTNYTLEVIAEKSGFNSLSTVRRCFLQAHGCSPSVYKKENRHLVWFRFPQYLTTPPYSRRRNTERLVFFMPLNNEPAQLTQHKLYPRRTKNKKKRIFILKSQHFALFLRPISQAQDNTSPMKATFFIFSIFNF